MAKKTPFPSQDQSNQCLQYLRRCGGSARLCSIKFSLSLIQMLVNQKLVKVTNTGAGFYVELNEGK